MDHQSAARGGSTKTTKAAVQTLTPEPASEPLVVFVARLGPLVVILLGTLAA